MKRSTVRRKGHIFLKYTKPISTFMTFAKCYTNNYYFNQIILKSDFVMVIIIKLLCRD